MDLNLSYSDSAAMSQLLQFVSCGSLDVKTHFFDVPPPKMEEKKLRRRRLKEEEAVCIPNAVSIHTYFISYEINSNTVVTYTLV